MSATKSGMGICLLLSLLGMYVDYSGVKSYVFLEFSSVFKHLFWKMRRMLSYKDEDGNRIVRIIYVWM